MPRSATPHDGLARLVLSCRALRSHVDALAGVLPAREDSPQLFRQLTQQVEGLALRFAHLRRRLQPVASRRSLLARVFGRREPRPGAPPRRDLEGNARPISVPELMGFLASSGKSGILWVSTREESFVLELCGGDLVRAAGDRTPAGSTLADFLVQQGSLSAADAERLGEEAREEGESLGRFLLSRGCVPVAELKRALASQARELFARLLASPDAIYRFQEGHELGDREALELNVTQLLIAALERRRVAEEAAESAGVGSA